MTHPHLFFGGRLAERTPEGLVKKQRIVAESIGSARFLPAGRIDDPAFHRASKGSLYLPAADQRDHAHEASRSIRDTAHPFEQKGVVGRIIRLRPCKSRRVNTRSAAERVYFQAGV